MTDSTPSVSVLMPVHNAGGYLRLALESITSQTLVDFELLAIDDGSSDDSRTILERHCRTDDRMRIWTREQRGVVATRNDLLTRATGRYVAWMDADDVSLPDRIRIQFNVLSSNPEVVCVGTWAREVDPRGRSLAIESFPQDHDAILEAQSNGGAMRFPTTMMRRDIAASIGGFREPFSIGEDFDFLLRMSERGRMMNLPTVTYLYRQHLQSICASLSHDWISYRDCILELAHERATTGTDRLQRGESLKLERHRAAVTRRQAARIYANWALAARVNGNLALTGEYILRSILQYPASARVWRTIASSLSTRPVRSDWLEA